VDELDTSLLLELLETVLESAVDELETSLLLESVLESAVDELETSLLLESPVDELLLD
jgi:hypothetical protein